MNDSLCIDDKWRVLLTKTLNKYFNGRCSEIYQNKEGRAFARPSLFYVILCYVNLFIFSNSNSRITDTED